MASSPPPAPLQRTRRRRRARHVDVSWATFLRVLAMVAVAWTWWHLWQWVLVFVLAAFIAVALDPAVQWLEEHRVRRRYGAPLVVGLIVLFLAGLVGASGASLTQQARDLASSLDEFRDMATDRLPVEMRRAGAALAPSAEALTRAAQTLAGGLAGAGVALVVAVYLLMDGRRSFHWLIAFVPSGSRSRAHRTAECGRAVIAAYVRGSLVTSLLAAVATWIALALMQVPAAMLLALLAGVLNLVPVVGLFVSAVPAVLLGLTVSPMAGLGVALFYVVYNMVETYYIQPKVYGHELPLSDLAVITAFLIGGTLGGVLGALIALPVAAMYPGVERIWFDGPGDPDTAGEHRRIQAQPEH